mmetsp:Transcript_15659/g.23341  ORF Transcript_15659/g.23341 Transcript_15659/m.23341 type:complete len:245 (+) Transcript_15659:119-853(+)
MPSIKSVKKSTVKDVASLIASVPTVLAAFDSAISTHFSNPSPSSLETSYSASLTASPDAINTPLISALSSYKDLLSQTIDSILLLERYVILHIPQMEDGNNFGVTVQMTVGKHLRETRESLLKKMDSLVSYYNSRADAVDKLSLEKKTFTSSVGSSKTESTKEEDKKESSSSSSDEKIVKVEDKGYPFRIMSLVALDVNAYVSAKSGLVDCFNDFLMVMDNVEKNQVKLTSPKGESGSNSMGMY